MPVAYSACRRIQTYQICRKVEHLYAILVHLHIYNILIIPSWTPSGHPVYDSASVVQDSLFDVVYWGVLHLNEVFLPT